MINPISIITYEKPASNRNKWAGKATVVDIKGLYIEELIYKPTKGNKNDDGYIILKPFGYNNQQLALSNPHLSKGYPSRKGSRHISKLIGSEITNDSSLKLYGDIQFLNNPILVELSNDKDTKIRTIKIMVFEGGSELAPVLYDKWLAGLIKESIPDHNIKFSDNEDLTDNYSTEIYTDLNSADKNIREIENDDISNEEIDMCSCNELTPDTNLEFATDYVQIKEIIF